MDRLVWNDADYEEISWHDNYVHAMSFNSDTSTFYLEFDHILKWVKDEKVVFPSWHCLPLCYSKMSQI